MHRPPSLPPGLLQLLVILSNTTPLLASGKDVTPTAVRKMSLDEGEKLMPEYLAFAAPEAAILDSRAYSPAAVPFQPPWGIHLMPRSSGDAPLAPRAVAATEQQRDILARLKGRQFSCPENTSACTNIGQTDYCCAKGTTCFVVEGAPASGNVGCCPNGQNCLGGVGDCAGGSTACAANVGGGCCIPGYVCANVGCEWLSAPHHVSVTCWCTGCAD